MITEHNYEDCVTDHFKPIISWPDFNPNQKHPSCKKSCGQELAKGRPCAKRCEIKWSAKASGVLLLIEILIITIQVAKY